MNRAIPPSIEHNSTYQPMIPALHITAKGIRLYCIEDHTQPLAFFSLTLRMGYTDGQPGLGYFASKMLTRGTHNSTAQHIADTIETWGGSLYTSIERDIMTISINILSRYFNDAVRLMAECVMQPAFQQYESDKLKIKIYADIERTENDPQAIAFKAAESRLYAGHPYEVQWYGSKKAIQDIQPEHCHQWHNDILSRNGFFVAAGDIQPKAVLNAIDELFPQLNAVEVNKNNSTPLTNPSHNRIIAIHRNNSLQSTIITGLHVPGKHHPDFIALRLLTAVLGGEGLSTRLTMALREEKLEPRLRTMLADVEAYNSANGVILPEPGYDPIKQLLRNNWPVLLRQLWLVLAAALAVLVLLAWGLVWSRRRWRHAAHRLKFAHRCAHDKPTDEKEIP